MNTNTCHSPARALSAGATAAAHDLEPEVKDELRRSSDMEVDSDTSSSYTDDEGSEASPRGLTGMGTGVWSKEEHAKFLEAIKVYSNGPWKLVAAYVGTRTVRQTMTHAQKYRQKAARRLRGLRTKQALMRMHFGHHVSEESLMQERLRTLGAAHNNFLACEPITYAFPDASVVHQPHSRTSCLAPIEAPPTSNKHCPAREPDVTPWVSPLSVEEPACLDATMVDVEEIDLLGDLTASPTLEECATELLKLLF
jgi:SHAQKYF class myb-like DNA-binding protein